MKDRDAIDMMHRCKSEIQGLRRANEEFAPKAEAYDTIRQILNMMPQRSHGMSEDIVWKLERQIADLEAQIAKSEPQPEKED